MRRVRSARLRVVLAVMLGSVLARCVARRGTRTRLGLLVVRRILVAMRRRRGMCRILVAVTVRRRRTVRRTLRCSLGCRLRRHLGHLRLEQSRLRRREALARTHSGKLTGHFLILLSAEFLLRGN